MPDNSQRFFRLILKMFRVKHFSSSPKPFAKLFGATQSPAFFRLILKMFHVKHLECARVRWHCVIGKEASDDLPQPPPLLENGLMPASPQLPFNLLQIRLHAIALALPLEEEVSSARLAAQKGEA
jgi:hypothetical protein